MQTDEASLIERSQRGDLDAFNALVVAYQGQVYSVCLRMLGSPQPAEDATQEAFIAAFRAVSQFRRGSLPPWLARVARHAPPRGADPAPGARPTPGEPLVERAERQELAHCLEQGLASLPADQRLAVVLRDVQGLAYEEVAEATGVSLGTVKSRISRGRAALRDFLLAQGELLPSRFRPPGEG